MKWSSQFTVWVAIITLGLPVISWSTVIYNDHFITAAVGFGENDWENGEYRNVFLRHANNRSVAGGSTVGYATNLIWTGSSDRPIMVTTGLSSSSVAGQGGAISMRGGESGDIYVYRTINYATGPETLYLTGTLSANHLDDDAVTLFGFSNASGATAATNMLYNTGDIFYNGLALGFKGDDDGGMDLILRYRDGGLAYQEQVLVAGISLNTPYTVVAKIEWDSVDASGNPDPSGLREPLSIWVNPVSLTEPATADFTATGFLGTADALKQVNVMQRDFGTSVDDIVYIDELRMAGSWEDLGVIPEPGTMALFSLSLLGLSAARRMRA